ncbi:MAG TPA: Rid family hydrolase [Sphingomicrobium sp.]|nr:Rid family hydrolase [Sphingomicrobium sp.]
MILEILLAAALAPQITQTSSGARHSATVIMSDKAGLRRLQERLGWADAIVSGDTVYVSGVVAGLRPGETDMEPGLVRAFDELGGILKRAGVTWNDVVEMRTYHTNPVAQIEKFAEVKMRFIKAPYPAWTAVGTTALLALRGFAEISLVAKVPKKGQP